MPTQSTHRLTPRQRFNRGLMHTATGPVDITRGAVGLGVHSVQAGAAQLRRTYRDRPNLPDVAEPLAHEVSAALEVVTGLPGKLRAPGGRRLKVVVGVVAVLLAVGAAAVVLVRRAGPAQEAPARPPSVDLAPRP